MPTVRNTKVSPTGPSQISTSAPNNRAKQIIKENKDLQEVCVECWTVSGAIGTVAFGTASITSGTNYILPAIISAVICCACSCACQSTQQCYIATCESANENLRMCCKKTEAPISEQPTSL